jgi:cellulose synthase (UDP-forming)
MMLHADGWKSYQHKDVECKMLSPQDLDTWVKQRSRYAAGSLDIAFKDNPLFLKGLSFGQRICYFSSIFSYFAPIWLLIFILSPVVFFYTLALPVKAYSFDFLKFYIPFQLVNTMAIAIANWKRSSDRSDQYYIASFWLMIMCMVSVLIGKKVSFNVTPKGKNKVNNLPHVWPHILIIGLIGIGIMYNLVLVINNTHPSVSGFITNTFWSLFSVFNLSVMVRAAYWKEKNFNIAKEKKRKEENSTPMETEPIPAIILAQKEPAQVINN